MDVTAYVDHPGGLAIYPSQELWKEPGNSAAVNRVVAVPAQRADRLPTRNRRPARRATARPVTRERTLVA